MLMQQRDVSNSDEENALHGEPRPSSRQVSIPNGAPLYDRLSRLCLVSSMLSAMM